MRMRRTSESNLRKDQNRMERLQKKLVKESERNKKAGSMNKGEWIKI